MGPEHAFRISVGITIVLLMQVEGVAVAAWLPVCDELLWIQLFVCLNLLVAYFALFETILVQVPQQAT